MGPISDGVAPRGARASRMLDGPGPTPVAVGTVRPELPGIETRNTIWIVPSHSMRSPVSSESSVRPNSPVITSYLLGETTRGCLLWRPRGSAAR